MHTHILDKQFEYIVSSSSGVFVIVSPVLWPSFCPVFVRQDPCATRRVPTAINASKRFAWGAVVKAAAGVENAQYISGTQYYAAQNCVCVHRLYRNETS